LSRDGPDFKLFDESFGALHACVSPIVSAVVSSIVPHVSSVVSSIVHSGRFAIADFNLRTSSVVANNRVTHRVNFHSRFRHATNRIPSHQQIPILVGPSYRPKAGWDLVPISADLRGAFGWSPLWPWLNPDAAIRRLGRRRRTVVP
jgi:hypothetical protein